MPSDKDSLRRDIVVSVFIAIFAGCGVMMSIEQANDIKAIKVRLDTLERKHNAAE